MKPKKRMAISKDRAIAIATNHNCVSRKVAEKYTYSELYEVLRQLDIKAKIK